MYRHLVALAVIAGLWIGAVSLTDFVDAAAGDEPPQQDVLFDVGPDFNAMQLSPYLFIGTLTGSVAGPVARSEPPIYSFTLTFQVSDVLRGDLEAGTSATLQFREHTLVLGQAGIALHEGTLLRCPYAVKFGKIGFVGMMLSKNTE